ncbi:PAN domain family protein [Brugia pahangi]
MMDVMKSAFVIMSNGTPSLIFLILLLSFVKQFINSEPFVPTPASIYLLSGSSHFNLSQQNQLSTLAYNLDQISNLTSNNPTFPSLPQKLPSISVYNDNKQSAILTSKYRRQEENLANNFYKKSKNVNVKDEITTNEAIFRSFQDDNFDESYQQINKTYFSEAINRDEEIPQITNIQDYLTTEPSATIIDVNKIHLQSVLSPLAVTTPQLLELVTSTAILLDDFNNKNEKVNISNRNFPLQKNYSTIPFALKYWEMQRTDSGQSIIRVTTTSTALQITTGRNEFNHLNIAKNDSTTSVGDNDNDNNKFNSDDIIRNEFTTLKKKSSLPQTINQQSTISANNNLNISDDKFIATTAINIKTISTNSQNLLSKTLTIEEQTDKFHFTTAKINLTESNVDSNEMQMTSINSSKFNQIIDADELTLNMRKDNFLFEKSQKPPEFSSFSVFHLQTSTIPSSSLSTLSSLSSPSLSASSTTTTTTIAAINDNSPMEISPADKFLSNNDEKIIKLNSENNQKINKIANKKQFDRKKINLDSTFAKNVEFDKLKRKEIETNLMQNSNEQWQTKKAKILIDKISTTHLPNNKLSSNSAELSSILGNQIDNAFSNLIHLEKQQMGISIPKYENSIRGLIFAQLPKQNGINTVMIDTADDDTGLSIKRGITKGKILEKQESFISGKPVTLELWNPIIYGHDWLANPGAIINGFVQPLQAQIHNVERTQIDGQNNRYHQQRQIFDVKSISNDKRLNEMSKERKKERKNENLIMDQTNRKEELAKACLNDEKGFNNSDEQESTVLIIYTEMDNNSVRNKLQGIGKYQNAQQCFYVMNNCALSATAPFERRIGISLMECAQFCSSLLGCLSASYSTRFSICDTFHFKFGSRGKKMMKLAWNYYLEPQANNNAPECFIESSLKQLKVNKAIRKRKQPIAAQRFFKQKTNANGMNLKISSIRHDNLLNYSKMKKQYDCLNGENVVVTKAPGWRIAKFNGRIRKYLTTEIDCLESCYNNRYKKNIAYHCSSAVFDEDSSRCSLYSTIQPTNNTLIRDTSTIYYEKHCFSEQLAKLCDGALIERQPQQILVTFPDAILTTSTLVKCLLKCFWSLQDGQTFQCHSLMYFYEQKVDNCVLNSRSKQNQPNSLRKETLTVVDYFGLDDCLKISLVDQVSKTNPIRTYAYKKHQNILISRKMHI